MTQSLCCDLLARVEVHSRYCVPLMCRPLLLWWWPLSSVIYEIDVRRSLNLPMSWDRNIVTSTPECLHWMWLYVPKWSSLLKPSYRQKSSALLLVKTLAPFLVAWWVRLGFPQGHMYPSSSLCFSWGRFCLSPHRNWKDVEAFEVQSPVWNLPTGPIVGTGRMDAHPLRSVFLTLSTAMYLLNMYWFFRTFWFWELALGRYPLLRGDCKVCLVAQTRILYVPCIPTRSSWVWGVCSGLLRGSTSQMTYFHLSDNVALLELL